MDISVIILTKNESVHMGRCLARIAPLFGEVSNDREDFESVLLPSRRVFVVDCYSDDDTVEIARERGAEVVQHQWPGTQAVQFNWALKHLQIETSWVLRLDADEYLTKELIHEIKERLASLPTSVTGVVFKRRHVFCGKWVRRGVYPVKLLRLFRYRHAYCEQRLMDEHIKLLDGQSIEFVNDFVDHSLIDISSWGQKHIGYAMREAIELLEIEYGEKTNEEGEENKTDDDQSYEWKSIQNGCGVLSEQAAEKRRRKEKYARLPLFWRSFAYFLYRYFLRGGFLDGKEGFLWHFLQGWWYRTFVDAKVMEIKRKCDNDPERIRAYVFLKKKAFLSN